MVDTAPSPSGIDALLEQRSRYEQWLARLDDAGGRAPDAVRERVRADYQQRLAGVIEQLRAHAATISGELEGHRRRQTELEGRRDAVQDRIAEAEVRHAVGEYTEEEWRRVSAETGQELAAVNEGLERVAAEIARLAEVDRLIAGGPAPVEAPAAEPSVATAEPDVTESAPAVVPADAEEVPAEPVAAEEAADVAVMGEAGTSSRPEDAEAPAEPQEDELAFLRSVAGDTTREPPAPRRMEPPTVAAVPAPAPTAAPTPAAPTAPTAAATATSAKTLKCGECGTLNRPTEWYCERCGAELSTL